MAQGRGVKPTQVRQWIDGAVYTPEQAKELGIIDSVQHRQDFEAELREKFGEDVKFDTKYGKKKQWKASISRRPSGCSSSGRKCSKAARKRRPART